MWGVISNLFVQNDKQIVINSSADNFNMNSVPQKNIAMEAQDSYDTRQAKQRASVKWLLSKAYNNRVPQNLREPFYRDHEEQEHLKPQILGRLASAELYCLALANIYADQNYHSLNHSSILTALARKGVPVSEDTGALTETVLIQTNPLRISAHMAVIESLMSLYAKEVATPERVAAAVRRFSNNTSGTPGPQNGNSGSHGSQQLASDHETALLSWVDLACDSLRRRIAREHENGQQSDKVPSLPAIREFKDLCDGIGLAALVSFYCPDELPVEQIQISYLPTVQESIHNLMLVSNFSQNSLPFPVFHLMPEDITYMRGAMKQNLVVFLADLFNVLEIHPAKCVRYSGPLSRSPSVPSVLPRSSTRSASGATSPTPTVTSLAMSEDSVMFPVHRGKAVPTLGAAMGRRSDSVDNTIPAGRPSSRGSSSSSSGAPSNAPNSVPGGTAGEQGAQTPQRYGGRRSRRNSITEESQLTIENFGGSTEHLNFIGRNTEKEVGGRVQHHTPEPSQAVRSTLQDARGSLQLSYDDDTTPNDVTGTPGSRTTQRGRDRTDGDGYRDIRPGDYVKKGFKAFGQESSEESNTMTSFGIMKSGMNSNGSNHVNPAGTANGDKRTSFATLPNTTTWQQQSNMQAQDPDNNESPTSNSSGVQMACHQLNDIRLKLEEKRRHIEQAKRKMEAVVSDQRQQVGKQAFLQAVTKSKSGVISTTSSPGEDAPREDGSDPQRPLRSPSARDCTLGAAGKPKRPVTLKEIRDEVQLVEHKWLEQNSGPFIETRRTPDIEAMDLEQYQHSIAQMNSSLQDIQSDIQRLASQQNQIAASQQHKQRLQQMNAIINNQQHYQQQPAQSLHYNMMQQPSFSPQQLLHRNYESNPHINTIQHHPQQFSPQPYSQQQYSPQPQQYQQQQNPYQSPQAQQYSNQFTQPLNIVTHSEPVAPAPQFYLHERAPSSAPAPQQHHSGQRRTWGQPAPVHHDPPQDRGFILHEQKNHQPYQSSYPPSESPPRGGFMLHESGPGTYQNGADGHYSPQHHRSTNNVHRQISQIITGDGDAKPRLQRCDSAPHDKPRPSSSPHMTSQSPHTNMAPALSSPPLDEMAPQSISFIASNEEDQTAEEQDMARGFSNKLNITSGSRTYRIPSPTRPSLNRNSFHQPSSVQDDILQDSVEDANNVLNEKGFYISFDNEQPKRPKPPLRVKRGSPKKDRGVSYIETASERQDYLMSKPNDTSTYLKPSQKSDKISQLEQELERERERQREMQDRNQHQDYNQQHQEYNQKNDHGVRHDVVTGEAIIIGNDLTNPDPDSVDEMERKKEKIMLLSLQRRQQQEEAKARKEQEAQQRREHDKAKEEERARRKEEQAARRAAILEQHKLKKAIEEAEREGKTIDKSELLNAVKPAPKLRPRTMSTTGRPRPKTIHIDQGSVEAAEGVLASSRGKRGSNNNLAGLSSGHSTMRRDYYRGSQDSLAGSHSYRESPEDAPGRSNPTLGRRGSYKTSREEPESNQYSPARGRPKYSTYQSNFKGRKSNSLMNLCDTDSGLGRATPPRRAPSPGMGPMRHLPSPSGPGSLPPGLATRRRMFDDGSSDISSASSMMDYSGPRLYKQPASKSNRNIMLNAVEYCVFPGVVNKEAKRRVLEEITRSESKHFLILFRDAGCQFRALYSYCPDREEVSKLYGTGPKQVNDRMFDKFFKYNSGGKCFSPVHTKHLTVTIDAFTIHNSLWQGKKVNLPAKKDMTLVI